MISVIIPLYNTSKYLKKCLDSIISQSYTDWECIIVDDCSTDNSYEIALEYMSWDKRFKVHKNAENLGCGLTRRRGISLAKGEWFSFVDSDDYIDNTFFEDMLNACIRTNSDIAVCGTYNRDENYNYIRQDIAEREYITFKEELYQQYMTSSWILQYNGNKFYSRKVIDAVEYSELRFCEDSTTTYKWLWEANRVVVIPRSYYHYVHHDDSNSRKNNTPLQKAIDTCKCVYDHFLFCKRQGFDDLIEGLKEFVRPSVVQAIMQLDINEKEYLLIRKIKEDMGL